MFRQEAIDFERQHRQGGQVALLQPLPTKIMTWLVAVSVGSIIIFLFLGQYARKETVVGFLAPTSGIAKIFATRPGTIKDIYVKEGEEVKKGTAAFGGRNQPDRGNRARHQRRHARSTGVATNIIKRSDRGRTGADEIRASAPLRHGGGSRD
jgi:multidrug efflux pump subunit AcrA (membrane-fusion protein)